MHISGEESEYYSDLGEKISRKCRENNKHANLKARIIYDVIFTYTRLYTGCFINYVTILNLYIIKISTLNCLTSKYYKNIVICILFGIKIYPYFHNLGLSYETLKKAQFL